MADFATAFNPNQALLARYLPFLLGLQGGGPAAQAVSPNMAGPAAMPAPPPEEILMRAFGPGETAMPAPEPKVRVSEINPDGTPKLPATGPLGVQDYLRATKGTGEDNFLSFLQEHNQPPAFDNGRFDAATSPIPNDQLGLAMALRGKINDWVYNDQPSGPPVAKGVQIDPTEGTAAPRGDRQPVSGAQGGAGENIPRLPADPHSIEGFFNALGNDPLGLIFGGPNSAAKGMPKETGPTDQTEPFVLTFNPKSSTTSGTAGVKLPGQKAAAGVGVTPPAKTAAPINSTEDRRKKVYDYWIGKGFTPAQAAGITGRFMSETADFDTAAEGDKNTSEPAVGAGQWRGPRRQALEEFAALPENKGRDPLEVQMDFAYEEMTSSEKKAYDAVLEAQTPEEAADAMQHFFRAQGYKASNPTGSINTKKSRANAAQVFKDFAGDNDVGGSQVPGQQFLADGTPVPPKLAAPPKMAAPAKVDYSETDAHLAAAAPKPIDTQALRNLTLMKFFAGLGGGMVGLDPTSPGAGARLFGAAAAGGGGGFASGRQYEFEQGLAGDQAQQQYELNLAKAAAGKAEGNANWTDKLSDVNFTNAANAQKVNEANKQTDYEVAKQVYESKQPKLLHADANNVVYAEPGPDGKMQVKSYPIGDASNAAAEMAKTYKALGAGDDVAQYAKYDFLEQQGNLPAYKMMIIKDLIAAGMGPSIFGEAYTAHVNDAQDDPGVAATAGTDAYQKALSDAAAAGLFSDLEGNDAWIAAAAKAGNPGAIKLLQKNLGQ